MVYRSTSLIGIVLKPIIVRYRLSGSYQIVFKCIFVRYRLSVSYRVVLIEIYFRSISITYRYRIELHYRSTPLIGIILKLIIVRYRLSFDIVLKSIFDRYRLSVSYRTGLFRHRLCVTTSNSILSCDIPSLIYRESGGREPSPQDARVGHHPQLHHQLRHHLDLRQDTVSVAIPRQIGRQAGKRRALCLNHAHLGQIINRSFPAHALGISGNMYS